LEQTRVHRWHFALVLMIRELMVVRYLAHTQILMTGPRSHEDFSNTSVKSEQFIIRSFPNRTTNGVVSYVGFDPQMLLEDLHRDRYCCCMATTMRAYRRLILEFSPRHTGQQICKLFLVLATDFVTTLEQSQFCSDGLIGNDQICPSSF
jgi:hypothetical protein